MTRRCSSTPSAGTTASSSACPSAAWWPRSWHSVTPTGCVGSSLACTSAGGAGGASFPLHELVALDADARAARQMELLDTRWDKAWQAAHPDLVAMITDRMLSGSRETGSAGAGLANQLAARAQHDAAARLGSIACPTLVCGGRFDALAPPANSEFLAGAIPGARLAMFDGGHLFLLQDRRAMPAVIEFLKAGAHRSADP